MRELSEEARAFRRAADECEKLMSMFAQPSEYNGVPKDPWMIHIDVVCSHCWDNWKKGEARVVYSDREVPVCRWCQNTYRAAVPLTEFGL
jgi:hypothetical protein